MDSAQAAAAARLVNSSRSLNTLMLKGTAFLKDKRSQSEQGIMLLARGGREFASLLGQMNGDTLIVGLDWTKRWSAKGETEAASIRAASTMCTKSFTVLLEAATAALPTLETALDSSRHTPGELKQKLFLCTWMMLADMSLGMTSCGLFSVSPVNADLRALQPVLNKLVSWLLQMIRLNKNTHQALRTFFKGAQMQHIYKFIDISLLVLQALLDSFPADLLREVNNLPIGFVSSLCCLACEAEPWHEQGPPARTRSLQETCASEYKHMIRLLAGILGSFLATHAATSSEKQPNLELLCPASVEVAKRAVFACYTTSDLNMDLTLAAQLTLSRTLMHSSSKSTPHNIRMGPSQSTLTPRTLTLDKDLLSLLLRCSVQYPCSLDDSTHIITCIVREWRDKTSMWVAPRGAACAALVLRYCSIHLCCLMEQQRESQQELGQQGQEPCDQSQTPTLGQTLGLGTLMLLIIDVVASKTVAAASHDKLTAQYQEEQISKRQYSYVFNDLKTWRCMPSARALLEMTLRHHTSNVNISSVNLAIKYAVVHLSVHLLNDPARSSSRSNISCVASIHKLLLIHTSAIRQAIDQRSQSLMLLKLNHIPKAHSWLLDLLTNIQKNCKPTGTQMDSDLGVSTDVHEIVGFTSPFQRGTHRLRAVLVMVLVWLCNSWRGLLRDLGGVGGQKTEEILGWVNKIPMYDAQLAGVARALSLPEEFKLWETRTSAFKQEAAVWDEYALEHFHGRLLPGCSYLGCTNMRGASEEALETLLCSGCRRMRYCRVACQRAAWVEGGHSRVCGQGRWAIPDVQDENAAC